MIIVLLGAPECGKTTQAERIASTLGLAKVHVKDVAQPGDSDEELAGKIAEVAATAGGMTLEDFPSTVAQAQALDAALGTKGMKVSKVIYIDVGECDWLELADPVLSMYYDRGMLASVDGRPFIEAVEEQVMAAVAEIAPAPAMEEEQIATYSADEIDTQAPGAKELDEVTSVRWIDPRRSIGGFTIGCSVSLLPMQKESRTTGSNTRYREDLHRHDRLKDDPCKRYPAPVTASMDIGWDAKRPELYKKDPDLFHPRMKSRETMYAEALILGPRHP